MENSGSAIDGGSEVTTRRLAADRVGRSRGLGRVIVLIGTFSAPLGQFTVFWAVARADGAHAAGTYALILTVGTFAFTATSLGLRDSYITLRRSQSLRAYALIRVAGVGLATAILLLTAIAAQLPVVLVGMVLTQKAADAITDLLGGTLQKQGRLVAYGAILLSNGVASAGLAAAALLLVGHAVAVVAASALGSVVALLASIVLTRRSWGESALASVPVRRQLVEILSSSWSIGLWQLSAVVIISLPTWIVALRGSEGEVGLFASIAYMLTAGSLMGTAVNYAVIGEYRVLYDKGGGKALLRALGKHNLYLGAFAAVAVAGVSVLGPHLWPVLFGGEFNPARAQLVVIALAAALNPISQSVNVALLVLNRYRRQSVASVCALAAMVTVAAVTVAELPDAVAIGCLVALVGSLTKLAFALIALRK